MRMIFVEYLYNNNLNYLFDFFESKIEELEIDKIKVE
jgi:hypothetical protein